MKLITNCHSSLPVNRKTKEVSEIMRQLVGTILEDREYSELVSRLEKLVDVANALYPKTTALWLRTSGEAIALALEGSDKSIWVAVHTVKQGWEDIQDILPK